MTTMTACRSESRREAAGFLVSAGFVCLASVRDVYLGGLFQRTSPPLIAIFAFIFGSAVFLAIGAGHLLPESQHRRPGASPLLVLLAALGASVVLVVRLVAG